MASSREGEDPALLCPSGPHFVVFVISILMLDQERVVNHLHLTDDRTGVMTTSRDGSLSDAGAAC